MNPEDFAELPEAVRAMIYNIRSEMIAGKIGRGTGERYIKEVMEMAKGGEFERDISRFLSRWWTYGERDDVFWRTSASGARATTRSAAFKDTKYEHGDITFTDPAGKPMLDLMVIEAKRGYTNTSRKIKKVDMDKICAMAAKACDPAKIKAAVQRLFSKAKKGGGVDLLDMIDSKVHQDRLPLAKWILKGEIDRAQAGVPYFILIGRRDSHDPFVLMPRDLLVQLELWQSPYRKDQTSIVLDVGIDRYYLTSCYAFFEWLEPSTIIDLAVSKPYRRFT